MLSDCLFQVELYFLLNVTLICTIFYLACFSVCVYIPILNLTWHKNGFKPLSLKSFICTNPKLIFTLIQV